MKKLLLLLLSSASIFAQTNTGELDKDGRILYEKVIEGASIEVQETQIIDTELHRVFDHRGVFKIGTQKGHNAFPFEMFVKYERSRSMLFMSVKYEIVENRIIITAKNTIDDLQFPLGIQYYIIIRYTKK